MSLYVRKKGNFLGIVTMKLKNIMSRLWFDPLTKLAAVPSYQPEAEDAKLMPVRMALPCALGAKYGKVNGKPTLSAAYISIVKKGRYQKHCKTHNNIIQQRKRLP